MLKMQPRALIEPFGWTVATRIPSRTRPFGDGAGGDGSFGFRLMGLGRGAPRAPPLAPPQARVCGSRRTSSARWSTRRRTYSPRPAVHRVATER